MENSLVVKTNVTSGTRSVGTVSGAYLNNGQTANQKMALVPGANYSSAVGFTAMTIGVTNGPVQLTASKGANATYINTMINQTTTIDDSVDTFVITNPNTNIATATVNLTYAINNAGVTPAASIVTSVDGQTDAVIIKAVDNSQATGMSIIADSGATTGNIKLLRLVAGNNVAIAPDGVGNLQITAEVNYPVTSVSEQTGAVVIETTDNDAATGVSLIADSGATTGNAKLKTLVAGEGITLTPDSNGNLQIVSDAAAGSVTSVNGMTGAVALEALDNNAASGISLVADSGTTDGTFKFKTLVAGSGVSISPDTNGNLTLASTAVGGVSSVNNQTGAVVIQTVDNNDASGVSLVADSGASTGTTKFKTLVAGSGITLAADSNGNLQISGSVQYTLPAATTSVLGGVIVSTGLAVDGAGHLTNAGVTSVNTRTGAVTLTSTDVGIPVDLLGGVGGSIASKYLPASITGAVSYQGSWNATTNSPSILTGSASAGNKGFYYVVGVAGTTTVDGISTWNVGDWIISDGTVWSRIQVSQTISTVNNQTGAVVIQATNNNAATGTSLISDGGATTGTIKLKTIVAGTGVTLSNDANGNLVVSGTASYTLPVATASVLGGVKQGSGVTIAGDGTLSVSYTLPAATTSSRGGVTVGSGINVDVNGVISVPNYSLPIATSSVLGGVKQGTGVSIAGDGTLSVSYSLPVATASVLGGVKQGTGVTIAGDGTLSVTATGGVTSFNTRTGAITLTSSDITTAGGAPSTSPSFTGRAQYVTDSHSYSNLGSVSGTVTLNFTTATEQVMTATGNITFAFSNPPATGFNQVVLLRITNGGTYSVAWPSNVWFSTGTAPTLTASGTDMLAIKYDATSSVYMVFVLGYAMAV